MKITEKEFSTHDEASTFANTLPLPDNAFAIFQKDGMWIVKYYDTVCEDCEG